MQSIIHLLEAARQESAVVRGIFKHTDGGSYPHGDTSPPGRFYCSGKEVQGHVERAHRYLDPTVRTNL